MSQTDKRINRYDLEIIEMDFGIFAMLPLWVMVRPRCASLGMVWDNTHVSCLDRVSSKFTWE
jgi:hypothetical protein